MDCGRCRTTGNVRVSLASWPNPVGKGFFRTSKTIAGQLITQQDLCHEAVHGGIPFFGLWGELSLARGSHDTRKGLTQCVVVLAGRISKFTHRGEGLAVPHVLSRMLLLVVVEQVCKKKERTLAGCMGAAQARWIKGRAATCAQVSSMVETAHEYGVGRMN
jgi:hypothetical protein